MATSAELRAQAQQLLQQAEQIERNEKDEAVRMIKELMTEHGLSIEDFSGKRRASGPTNKVPAKYRGPEGQEWSGRGRMPLWISQQIEQGKSREDFAI